MPHSSGHYMEAGLTGEDTQGGARSSVIRVTCLLRYVSSLEFTCLDTHSG